MSVILSLSTTIQLSFATSNLVQHTSSETCKVVYLANLESDCSWHGSSSSVKNGFIQKIYYRNILKKEFECHILDLVLKALYSPRKYCL